jgi:DNA-binding beta-propeller fold protein YncE
VAGTVNNVVYRFDPSGKPLAELNGSATPAGSFTPGGVAVDASGNLFVADRANDVVDEFSAAGAHLGQLSSPEILDPGSIAVDSSDDVYLENGRQSVDAHPTRLASVRRGRKAVGASLIPIRKERLFGTQLEPDALLAR